MARDATHGASADRSIFPTFFMTGFECSTFIWKDGERKDYVRITAHDKYLEEDYQNALDLAIRWPLADLGNGRYDWSTVDPVLKAVGNCHMKPIWDLCHYGFPDGCDPFSKECLQRFVD